MQLAKAKLRRMPTYHEVECPTGVKRSPEDYNQINNSRQVHRNWRGDNWNEPQFAAAP